MVCLTELLTEQRVKIPLTATTKEGAIEELVDVLDRCGDLDDRGHTLRAVLAREGTRTTGIGNGLAIPHGKCDGARQLSVAFGKPAEPLDFSSTDGRPVSLIVLLVSPTGQTGMHIQALARISKLMSSGVLRQRLMQTSDPQAVIELIRSQEQSLP